MAFISLFPLHAFLVLFFPFAACKLIQLHVLSRHCDRLPVTNLRLNSVYGPPELVDPSVFLDAPLGTLTSLGVAQCYALGELLKSRYVDPNSPNVMAAFAEEFPIYNPKQFVFYSSHITRTMRSVESIAQALFSDAAGIPGVDVSFPPLGLSPGDAPLPSNVQPIPVSHVGGDNDVEMLGYQQFKCEAIRKNWEESELRQAGMEEYAPMIEKLREIVADDQKDHLTFDTAFAVFDLLRVLKTHQRLPSALVDIYNDAKNISDYSFRVTFGRETVGNLGGGELLRKIVAEMDLMLLDKGLPAIRKEARTKTSVLEVEDGLVHPALRKLAKSSSSVSPSSSAQKAPHVYVHYSAHDSTIGSVLSALRLSEDFPVLRDGPQLGAALIFELHEEDISGKAFVRIVYLDGWNGGFQEYALTSLGTQNDALGCQGQRDCVYSQFRTALFDDAIPENWCLECGLDGAVVDSCRAEAVELLQGQTSLDQTVVTVLSLLLGAALVSTVLLGCGVFLHLVCKRDGCCGELMRKVRFLSNGFVRLLNGQGFQVSVADQEGLLQSSPEELPPEELDLADADQIDIVVHEGTDDDEDDEGVDVIVGG